MRDRLGIEVLVPDWNPATMCKLRVVLRPGDLPFEPEFTLSTAGRIGPTCSALVRLVHHLDGETMRVLDVAEFVGVSGTNGKHGVLHRAFGRLEMFGAGRLICASDDPSRVVLEVMGGHRPGARRR